MSTTLEQRLVDSVSRRLCAHVEFVRWIPRSTGDVPVFRVPSDKVIDARSAGLTVVGVLGR